MVPVVTFVGYPNAGESTLFNCLTHIRDALVTDSPGLVRGREYSRAEIEGHEPICVDTGRIDGTEDGVETRMAEQSLLAIEKADVVLSTVDARSSLVPMDEVIAKHLHSCEEPTFLVANRVDGLDPDQTVVDFCAFGLSEIYPIAASHGHSALSLLKRVLLPWMEDLAPREEVDEDAKYWAQLGAEENGEEEEENGFNPQNLPIRLAIVGRPSIGESTPTGRILGEERVIVYNIPGTTRDSIYIPMGRDGHEYVLIDTIGVHKRGKITDAVEKLSVIRTLQAIEDVNVVMLMVNAREGISDQDLSLLGFILNGGCSLVIVVNKWNDSSQEVKEQVKETLDLRLGFTDFVRVRFIPALHSSGTDNLFESIREAYGSSTHRVGTSMLTRITTIAVESHQSPLVCGHCVRLRYAHAGDYNLPIVVIHGNQVRDLPDSYKRYLMNYFCKSLDVMGSPIRIQFKEGENPYADKRNTLTPTQMRKRRHLVKHIRKSK